MRVGCLLVPDLPLQAAFRAEPELRGRPLVVTSGRGRSRGGRCRRGSRSRQSVRPGQTLPQARAVCPGIEVRVASPVLERNGPGSTARCRPLPRAPRAGRPGGSGLFTSEGVVFVDASGTTALHGDESSFASVFHARAERPRDRRDSSRSPRPAASRRLAARHLSLAAMHRARSTPSSEAPTTRVLPREREVAFLEPLPDRPPRSGRPDGGSADAVRRTPGPRAARLPARDLAARDRPAAPRARRPGTRREEEPPIPEPRTTTLEEGQDLEAPLAALEPLTFVLRDLVSRLTERLALRGLGCTELRLGLQLENGAHTEPARRRRDALPGRAGSPPPAPADRRAGAADGPHRGCDAALRGAAPAPRTARPLPPRGPSPSDLDQTLAELTSICGEDRVGSSGDRRHPSPRCLRADALPPAPATERAEPVETQTRIPPGTPQSPDDAPACAAHVSRCALFVPPSGPRSIW